MTAERRRILRFALAFLPAFVAAACLYPLILPAYQRGVFAAVNTLLSSLNPVSEIRAVPAGQWQVLVHRAEAARVATYTLKSDNLALLSFFQLAMLSALLLATPVRVRERLRLWVSGIGLMFGLHVLCVAGCVYGMALVDNPKGLIFKSLPIILGPFASGLAVAAWGLLTWKYWLTPLELVANSHVRVGRHTP